MSDADVAATNLRASHLVFTPHDILWSILLPAIIALVILLISRLRPIASLAPLAIALAFLIAFPGLKYPTWQFPPLKGDSTDKIFFIAA
ncbi:MAG TPA: hypothetical protein VHS31_19905, partial [Tepidisphaeraceae bacterium]|nr:hypothetical protein [Tepidisphaeraceae bacterium]